MGRAEVALARGEPELAVPLLRRILAARASIEHDPGLVAAVEWALGRALRPDDRASEDATAEAVELVLSARAAYVAAQYEAETAKVDAWLERCGQACNRPTASHSTDEQREVVNP